MKEIEHYYIRGVHFSAWIEGGKVKGVPSDESIHLSSNNLSRCIKLIEKRKTKNVQISPNEYKEKDLKILSDSKINLIESLSIRDMHLERYPEIEKLDNLKKLYISGDKKINIDLARLGQLEHLSIDWSSKVTGISQLKNLKKLVVYYYKNQDLSDFSQLEKLEELIMVHGSFIDFNGIQTLYNLETVDIDTNRGLTSLNGFCKNHNKIKSVRFYGIPNLYEVSYLQHLKNLEYIQITKFKSLDSVKFLNELENLKRVAIRKENIADGDLTPLDKY